MGLKSSLTAGQTLVQIHVANRDLTAAVGTHTYLEPVGWREYEPMRTANGRWYTSGPLIAGVSAQEELDGNWWLHISVSCRDRYPTYPELSRVKRDFIGPARKAIHIWPKEEEHIDDHPFCLHLWSCLHEDVLPDFRRWDEERKRWSI